ncbi:DUF2681 domain-containing protein [Testudinibacter sp. TR-2022]|uniref:DUF2681 domain-containing protein n=1 Tax=Testudinibacter sp. TR-2022 TaxID=2585029 RepID=UPI0011198135|nr:DUF2681 domain-containing protein [Testudinibacter sp. TR-2022]TNH04509.1 DUF2681 domain-containing protein [Pasteurellaceae bacterium Phil31]TNH11969.1 DUF2681 domain-containing protein [Testudinibacter sp. TR-2022]TNH12726.1 DUF2681 domain-containing protein [Testudinibacter sp. TR-2022]TNH13681.1 DUF2681 domain-containing protein [Testudinibacter sp. TR-2022]TNH17237.1 DUF2681 domain-containing protein [Testudinibacter sp. TR-2022]
MINWQLLTSLGGFVIAIIGYLTAKSAVQKRLLSEKEQEMQQVRSEKAMVKKELDNAEIRKQVEQNTVRLNVDDVDRRLHERGEFRRDERL